MSTRSSDIAVIGMSGEFPGSKTIGEFWNNLIHGKESISTFTPSDVSDSDVPISLWSKPNYIPRSGILHDIDQFAADFFGYSPREASLMDPQQRKLLEHAWLACEDAAINPLKYEGLMGIFASSSFNTYLLNNLLSDPAIRDADDIQQILFGNGVDYLATRIAYQLNCRGSAMNIQTACSSSLVAIHEACQQLMTYQVDVALAGGVSIKVPEKQGYLYSVDGLFSSDGHCRPFSNEANGTLFSNGLGIVVLKRLRDALQDGNPIYAVVKGSAINNDGHDKVGYTAPSVNGQADVIALALTSAGVQPEDVSYIEAHGTGTQLGDPIELAALQQVFSEQTNRQEFCSIGSLKSNIGHLDAAAGIAGFIKATLVLYHQQIPATLFYQQGTKNFDWKNSAFYVNSTVEAIQTNRSRPAIAGVSSFGIGGTNAHVVLEQHEKLETNTRGLTNESAILCFSAKTKSALDNLLENFVKNKGTILNYPLESVARTLQEGRAAFRFRTTLLVESLSQAMALIVNKQYEIVCCESDLGHQIVLPIEVCTSQDLSSIAEKWLLGYDIDWKSHYLNYKPQMLHLPVYPFEKKSYWIESAKEKVKMNDSVQSNHYARQLMDNWFYQPSWKPHLLSFSLEKKIPHVSVIFIHESMQFILDEVDLNELGNVIVVYVSHQFEQLNTSTFSINPTKLEDYKSLFNALRERELIPDIIIHAFSLTRAYEQSSVEIFKTQHNEGLLSAIYVIQAYESIFYEHTLKFTVLTNRLNRVAEASIEPHKAPILAAVKVIPKEYCWVESQLIDLDFIDFPQYQFQQCRLLINEIQKPQYTHEEILYRGMNRWVRTYTPILLPAPEQEPFSNGTSKVFFIAGGLGQLGLDIADYFSQFSGVKLALIARKSLPDPELWESETLRYDESHPTRLMLERLIKLRRRGCNVHTFKADISDQCSVESVVEAVERKLGPINGVIHAAGETINGIISMKSEQSLNESYQAKVYGSYYLCEAFSNKNFNFVILCSSMNAIIGGLGQLDNTAANVTVDYLAEYYSAKTGRKFISINWGAINMDRPLKVNVVPQFANLSTEHKRNRMNDDETKAVYSRLLSQLPTPRIVISTLPMDDVLLNWNRVASLKELDNEITIHEPVHKIVPETELPKTEMECWVSDIWSRILGIPSLSKSSNFFSLGGHSLSAVQFVTRVLNEHGLKIHVMNLYELPTLAEFSNYLEKLLQQKQNMTTGEGVE